MFFIQRENGLELYLENVYFRNIVHKFHNTTEYTLHINLKEMIML